MDFLVFVLSRVAFCRRKGERQKNATDKDILFRYDQTTICNELSEYLLPTQIGGKFARKEKEEMYFIKDTQKAKRGGMDRLQQLAMRSLCFMVESFILIDRRRLLWWT